MLKNYHLIIPFALALLVGCNNVLENEKDLLTLPEDAMTKVIRTSDEFDSSSFLVKFNSIPDEALLESIKSNGIASVSPLFPSCPQGREELRAQFGLDRWYEVTLADGADINFAVTECAKMSEIKIVEYSCMFEKCDEGDFVPASAEDQTKASDDTHTFNDPLLPDQWHYRNMGSAAVSPNAVKGGDINVNDVWKTLGCGGDPDIIVAVVDEGVKYTHPDLKDNMWTNAKEIPGNGIDDDKNGYIDDIHGFNFVTNGEVEWTADGNSGHGTHCAGTIAAVNNNNKGVCGVAGGTGKGDGCKIMSCQIFSGGGGASSPTIAKAVAYAADNGASIISCSFGTSSQIPTDDLYYGYNSVEIDAVHYFEACKNNPVLNGNIAIFAAGNESHNYAHYPGAFVDIISVSALGPDMLPTYYTNYGPGCNIAAPGGEVGHVFSFKSEVLSTVPSELTEAGETSFQTGLDYGYMQGTSMACPHVSGVVALALSYAKKLGKTFDRDEFKRLILSSTKDIDQKIAATTKKSYPSIKQNDLEMHPFYHQMGTGAIDTWQLMMHIEGVPTLITKIGTKDWIDISEYFGTSSVSLTYLSLDVPQATIDALGLQEISASNTAKNPAIPEKGYAYIQYGRLYMQATKIGSGKVTIHAVGGGDHLGGGSNPTGGMEIVQEISIVSRDAKSSNGGWL